YSTRSRVNQCPPSRSNSGDIRCQQQQQQPLHSQHRSDHVLIKQRHRSLSSERNHRSTSSTKQRSPSPSGFELQKTRRQRSSGSTTYQSFGSNRDSDLVRR
ncbi:unnamed protein product, partial [Didymodactylos carnosus]